VSLAVDPGRIAGDQSIGGFADGDFDALVDAVSQVATDKTARENLGTTGQHLFETQFEIGAVASTYGDVLRQQCSDR